MGHTPIVLTSEHLCYVYKKVPTDDCYILLVFLKPCAQVNFGPNVEVNFHIDTSEFPEQHKANYWYGKPLKEFAETVPAVGLFSERMWSSVPKSFDIKIWPHHGKDLDFSQWHYNQELFRFISHAEVNYSEALLVITDIMKQRDLECDFN